MRIAIPLFYSRVSPHFSYAQEVLLATQEGDGNWTKEKIYWGILSASQKASSLSQLGVDVLICGGIHGTLFHYLESQGIRVLSGVIGEAEEALRLYSAGTLVAGTIRPQRFHRTRCGCGPPWLRSEKGMK